MPSERGPVKPDRRRGVDGRFRCYRCPGLLAVAGVREMCCRNCLLLLVRKAVATELSGLRRKLAEHSPQYNTCKEAPCEKCDLCINGEPLFIALSGGDASLSLLHAADELVQRRRRARLMQRQRQNAEASPSVKQLEVDTRGQYADFGCCVALHVDVQRLFRPTARLVRVGLPANTQTMSTSGGARDIADVKGGSDRCNAAYGLLLPSPAPQSLPLQLLKAVTRQWPAVRCVLLHPSGVEYSVVENQYSVQQPGNYVELYRRPDGKLYEREQLEALMQYEERLRQFLIQTLAEDKTTAERLCRTIMLRSLRQYFSRRIKTATCSQGMLPAFLCVGDSATAAALGVLERVTYGEGRLLATESAPIDDRCLPLFHLCRPVVELSKKELALFRIYEKLVALPTQPYLVHTGHLPYSTGAHVHNQHTSVRWLLQEFLFEMQRENSASVHNLISASRKLEPFTRWSESGTPCCLCWKAPAVNLADIINDKHVVTPRQLRVVEEHLLSSGSATRLCFACFRDATATPGASEIVQILACDVQPDFSDFCA